MGRQLEEAVMLLLNPGGAGAEEKAKAMGICEHVRESWEGLQLTLALLGESLQPQVKFWCLQVSTASSCLLCARHRSRIALCASVGDRCGRRRSLRAAGGEPAHRGQDCVGGVAAAGLEHRRRELRQEQVLCRHRQVARPVPFSANTAPPLPARLYTHKDFFQDCSATHA